MRVLVVTGASGGHIFPALSFLDTLKDRKIDGLLVLSKRSIKNQIIPDSCKVKYLSISPIELRLDFKNFIAILRFLEGALESLFILLEFKPDIVVGFGSLNSVPLVMLAWIFRIRTLIHEQNVIPGRANRLLAKFTDRVAISFAETKDYLKISQEKIALTGNPIRPELERIEKEKALSFFGFANNKLTVLVMGGSQGSHKINMVFSRAISIMQYNYRLQVIHITGTKDYDLLNKSYKDLSVNVKSKIFSFFNQMQYAYSACDLVVCRAGATTISELIFFRLPAIIVPYPFAYQHQLSNARVLGIKGCAIVIKDNYLDTEILRKILNYFVNTPDKIKFMCSCYDDKFKFNANKLLVDEALSLN